MKNCLTILAVATAIAIASNFNLDLPFNREEESLITLTNIEALAKGEGVGKSCEFNGSVDCPHSGIKVLYVE